MVSSGYQLNPVIAGWPIRGTAAVRVVGRGVATGGDDDRPADVREVGNQRNSAWYCFLELFDEAIGYSIGRISMNLGR